MNLNEEFDQFVGRLVLVFVHASPTEFSEFRDLNESDPENQGYRTRMVERDRVVTHLCWLCVGSSSDTSRTLSWSDEDQT